MLDNYNGLYVKGCKIYIRTYGSTFDSFWCIRPLDFVERMLVYTHRIILIYLLAALLYQLDYVGRPWKGVKNY